VHCKSVTADHQAEMFWKTVPFPVGLNDICLQCFDAVGWVAGRASGLGSPGHRAIKRVCVLNEIVR